MLTASTSLDLMASAHAERSELATLLATLTPAQWQAPSLCDNWRVRDVVAHMISYDDLTPPGLVWRFVRGGLNLNRINAIGVTRAAHLSTAELLAEFNAHLMPRGLTAAYKGGLGLVDGLIHHQDIRRPLGIPRSIPPERLSFALDFALKAPTLRGSRLTHGLYLVATDLDWSRGEGREVRGPGEALLMAIAGRRGIACELTGSGQSLLQQRIGG